MDDDERRRGYQSSPPTTWGTTPHIYPHSHHGTPAQEYSGFNFSSPQLSMGPDAFRSNMPQRPLHPQLQPLIMPQWPSMLNSSQVQSTFPTTFPPLVQPIQPMSIGALPTPVSATSTRSASRSMSTSTPRRTLTDSDRKRMCQYAEDNPNSKQTEIGAIFGVERSTVSKVLRQKEKYMVQDEPGSRSPKRNKGRSPDIERALAVWANKQEKKGFPLTDDEIRDMARAFSATATGPENYQTLTDQWISKFKLKNNLLGARSRKASLAPDDAEGISATASSSHSPNGISPVSSKEPCPPSPQELHSTQSLESLKHESPDSYHGFSSGRGMFHSQSTNSLNSAFTDTGLSSFSPGPLSPTTSPFFTPDSGTAPGPFAPPLTARPILPTMEGNNVPRPRSQTFPLLDQYMSSSSGAEAATPKYITTFLDSPMEEPSDPLMTINEALRGHRPDDRLHTVSPQDTMRPPPLPPHILANDLQREITPATLSSSLRVLISPEEAKRSLQTVMGYIDQKGAGYMDFNQATIMGGLMEKINLDSRASSLA